jgi:hypothetical protein
MTTSKDEKFTKQQIAAVELDLLKISNARTVNLEKQKLNISAIARIQARLAANPLNFKDTAEFLNADGGIIDTLTGAGEEGLETALTDIANLWAQQREEAAGLEQELVGLNEQYQKAMSEGNVEKARQLEQQMGKLRNRIDDLNNPLKNLANTFKEFALTVVKELQKVIIKMLIVKILSSIFGGGGGGGVSFPGAQTAASGGVVPGGTFKNFRKFAQGGTTNGVGAAILGDNPSGKELVIPSENIENDKVSGKVRTSGGQPINIINILTQEDIARAMAGSAGQKTIINAIGKDIGKRGPTFRAIHS